MPRSAELDPITRVELVGAAKYGGVSTRDLHAQTGIPQRTVAYTIKKATERNQHQSAPRSGRPRKTDRRIDSRLAREARKDHSSRRQPLAELQQNVASHISRRTIQRRLQERHIKNWIAASRPMLDKKAKKARLDWALAHQDWTVEDWAK